MLKNQSHIGLSGIIYKCIVAVALLLSFARPALAISADESTAVVFVYQRVGDDANSQSGNISLEQFKQHIQELESGGYHVARLGDIVAALKAGKKLPHKTVAITFDGAYLPTMDTVQPLLDAGGLPFTVFFASDIADASVSNHMSWDQLKALKKDRLASLGILPSGYVHMTEQTTEQNAAMINKAIARYREVMGEEPQFFAYPYGEYSLAVKKQIATYPFKATFGQQSGVMHTRSDFNALPRFTMTDTFGNLDRFEITANALPIPVADVMPEDILLTSNPPMIGFTVTPEITDLSKLSCFVSSLGKVPVTHLQGNRIEIRLQEPLADRRTRINCTMPSDVFIAGEPPSWRWYGRIVIAPGIAEAQDSDDDDDTADSPDTNSDEPSGDE